MKHKELKRIIAEELANIREAMPLPPEEEYEAAVEDAVAAAIEAGEDPEELAANLASAKEKLQTLMAPLDENLAGMRRAQRRKVATGYGSYGKLKNLLLRPIEDMSPAEQRESVGVALKNLGVPLAAAGAFLTPGLLFAAVAGAGGIGAATVGTLAMAALGVLGDTLENRARIEQGKKLAPDVGRPESEFRGPWSPEDVERMRKL